MRFARYRPENALRSLDPATDDDELVWYFAFGSNMDPDVLGKVRQVFPTQSHPCKAVGYTLTFSHIGLPYLEPAFASIEPLSWSPQPPTLIFRQPGSAATADKVTMYSTPPAPLASALANAASKGTNAASNAFTNATSNGGAYSTTISHTATSATDPSSPRPKPVDKSPFSSPELPVSFGSARGAFKRGRVSPVSEHSSDYESDLFTLDGSHPPGHPSNVTSTSDTCNTGCVMVHGVAHQITQADMRQIVRTEGGGGTGNRGYYAESILCQLYNGDVIKAVTLLTYQNSMHRQVC